MSYPSSRRRSGQAAIPRAESSPARPRRIAHTTRLRRPATVAAVGLAALLAPATAAASLVATTDAGAIVIARDDGTGARVLVAHAATPHQGDAGAVISPDGRLVAVSTTAGFPNLAIYPAAGGAPTILPGAAGCSRWMPNSKALVCAVTGGIETVNAATGVAAMIATGNFRDFAVSPSGTRIAAIAGGTSFLGTRVETIDIGTGKVRVLHTGAVTNPVWGPGRVAFATWQRRPHNRFRINIASVHVNGTGFRRITRFRPTSEIEGLIPTAWSANGHRMLAGNIAFDFEADLDAWAVDPIHRTWRRLPHALTPTALSRDGRYVLGATGDAEKTGIDHTNVVRATWVKGGPRKVLLHRAWGPSWTR